MSILIAIPSHRGSQEQCAAWVGRVIQGLGEEVRLSVMLNCPCIDVARSHLLATFLKSGCSHLLFRDDDVDFGPEVLRALRDAKADIVVAPYRKRIPPHDWALRVAPNGFVYPGLGCCLIARPVLEQMIQAHPELVYQEGNKTLVALFHHMFVEELGVRMFLQEDHAFFCRAQTMGFKIRVLEGAQVIHGGVSGEYHP